MCGRFNMTTDPLTRLFMALVGREMPGGDRLNVAPTETVPVVAMEGDERRLAEMRWWLVPHWAKAPSTRYAMFNARAESVARSNAFRTPFRRRRCIVPVSGFFEWIRAADGRKDPHHVAADGDDGLRLAGLWDRWAGDDETLESFTIVTTAAHGSLAWLHDRQPLMLAAAEAEQWLDAETDEDALAALCRPRIAGPIAVVPVSRRVNDARYKGEACLEPAGEARHLDAAPPDD